ncbi:MAG: Sulfide dehydrogenase [flavocytochrome c] flavoprotein chain precursor, partial [Pseudomonadota bacterium]
MMKRRQFALGALGGGALLASGCASTSSGNAKLGGKKVVVVGGGYGGATAAKYVRMWSNQSVEVTLVEPNGSFISCPISNLVVGGTKTIADITTPYDNLVKRHGVRWVQDMAVRIDPEKQTVTLGKGDVLPYDRLILSPGVDFMWETLPGMAAAGAKDKILHAWKAGDQTIA